jgi:hypothetical protein
MPAYIKAALGMKEVSLNLGVKQRKKIVKASTKIRFKKNKNY